jgi:alcohol dehydrogenase class IV
MNQRSLAMKFDFPTSWRHGRGLSGKSGSILRDLGCNKTLLLTDKLLVDLGVVKPVVTSLEQSNLEYLLCDDVTEEPTVGFFETLVKNLDLEEFDSILAVGGGSVIDVAKGLAVIAQFGGHIRDYGGLDRIPEPLTRTIIAVPTTSGTGSEISDGIVLIDEKIQSKFLVLSTRICPAVAITDPEITKSMPPNITANSGVDALTHAIESYLSKEASVASELFSIRAIELIGRGLKRAYYHGKDIDARETVQVGSTMAMIAGMNAHMGLCHAMVMPLCALYHIPHGQACGMVLPHVLGYNEDAHEMKVTNIFKALGFIDSEADTSVSCAESYQRLNALLEEVGISARLSDFGYREDHMQTIVQETFNSVQCQFNPRKTSEEDIIGIVKKMI